MILEIIPQAQSDIRAIAKYYQALRDGLDDDFLTEISRGASAIGLEPLRFEQVRPGIRRYLLDRFPYGIYFRMQDVDTVRIVLVKHHSRGPGLGMRRK